MRKGTLPLAVATLLASGTAWGDQEPRGIFLGNNLLGVQVQYFEIDDDVSDPIADIDSSAVGYAMGGRIAVNERIDLTASIGFASVDFETTDGENGDVDVRTISFGPTFIIDDTTDWITAVSAEFISARSEASLMGQSETDTDTGFSLTGGAERVLNPDTSLLLALSYTDINESTVSGLVGGAFNLNKDLLFTTFVEVDFDDTLFAVGAGLDYRFGQ